jgi:hypothetical protein
MLPLSTDINTPVLFVHQVIALIGVLAIPTAVVPQAYAAGGLMQLLGYGAQDNPLGAIVLVSAVTKRNGDPNDLVGKLFRRFTCLLTLLFLC